MTRRHQLLAAAGLLAAACNKPIPANPEAKGLTGPTQPVRPNAAAPKDEIEFAYALEIPDKNELPLTVQDTFKFRTGERFRLQWTANFAAHIYIFNRGPKSNHYARLYPALQQDSLIGATAEPARIPRGQSDWLRFDKTPGDEQMILIASRATVPALERDTPRYTVEEFDRILIALERSRRPRSLRRFDDGHWHRCIAAGPLADLAVVNRLPLYHE
jgi:hypothetical protein